MSNRDDHEHRRALADLRAHVREQDAVEAAQAFRKRALEIAILQSCLCLYPLQGHVHTEWCPAKAMAKSAREASL